jgi:putative flippase GtrA
MPAQVIRYLIVGVTSVAVYFAVLSFLTSHEGAPRIGSIFVAYALATVVNYLANYYWAFAAEASHHQAMGRYALIVVAGP